MNQNQMILAADGAPTFNLNDVKGVVADQMRAFLINMMPKEAFDQVIETAWRKLTEPRPEEKSQYGNVKTPARPSELEQMVTKQMREELQKRVKEWGEEWRKNEDCDLGVKTMFAELIDVASSRVIRRIATDVVMEAAQALGSSSSSPSNNIVPCGGCSKPAFSGQSCGCGHWN